MRSTKQVKYDTKLTQPIVLIGFMGSGKTTLGRRLGRALGYHYVDLDQALVRRAGCSIPRFFKRRGEQAFRELESRVLRSELKAGRVVALGGGAVLRPENRALLKARKAIVLWVNPCWESLWSRLRKTNRESRPLLWDGAAGRPRPESAIRKLWSARRRYYAQVATTQIKVPRGELASKTLKRMLAAIQ